MNIKAWKSVFSRYYYNCHANFNKLLSTSAKLDSKKQYRVKNKFIFQDDLKKIPLENSKNKIYSSELFLRQNIKDQDYEHSNTISDGFVSGDLLSQNENEAQRKIKLRQKTKIRKPSLTYQGEILFGVHPVYLALLQKKRTFYQLYAHEGISSTEAISRKREIIKFARILNIPISYIDSRGLNILAPDAVHQGICLDAGFLPLPFWNEDQYNLDTCKSRPLWLVLNEILDPMNVGAIIRSAYYFGVNMLFIVKGNSCKLSPTVSKASSGTLEVMNIHQIENLEEFIMRRKNSGWSVASTLSYSSNESGIKESFVSADQFSTSKPTILILGNEGKGISENILKLCDSLISIEPAQALVNGIDSLNVSVAAGVLLYVLSNPKNKR